MPAYVVAIIAALMVAGGGPALPRPAGAVQTPPAAPVVTGAATWYGTGPGSRHAAAGPALRRFLGRDWRGTRVRVSGPSGTVVARLTDWCRCPNGRLIDLSDEDFQTIAPLTRGVITVTIKEIP